MNRKRIYDAINTNELHHTKRKYSSVATKYARRLKNVFTSDELLLLTSDAEKHVAKGDAKHGDDSSKRFCFNACLEQGGGLNRVEKLFGELQWDQVDAQVKSVVIKAIQIAVAENRNTIISDVRISSNDVIFVCFELIYIPLQSGTIIPGLEWHTDDGYNSKTGESFCYADTTTVFMLTDPNTWKGGNLQIRDGGNSGGNGTNQTYKYAHNEAVTFINKNTQHRVTRIIPFCDSARIALIVSVYGPDETSQFLSN